MGKEKGRGEGGKKGGWGHGQRKKYDQTKMDISEEVCEGVHLVAKNETEKGQAALAKKDKTTSVKTTNFFFPLMISISLL